MWAMYKEPSHSFSNRNQLIKAVAEIENREKIGNRKPYYDAIKSLMNQGLVEFEKVSYDPSRYGRETGKILLTKKGLDLIQKARKEKVTTWQSFLEKYKKGF
ncbi:MAG: hypothetical protein GWN56_10140 [Nitrosopumilaceae archaeon]|nr:hypothetical protein [Nitrosopumilaceae archaeon]